MMDYTDIWCLWSQDHEEDPTRISEGFERITPTQARDPHREGVRYALESNHRGYLCTDAIERLLGFLPERFQLRISSRPFPSSTPAMIHREGQSKSEDGWVCMKDLSGRDWYDGRLRMGEPLSDCVFEEILDEGDDPWSFEETRCLWVQIREVDEHEVTGFYDRNAETKEHKL